MERIGGSTMNIKEKTPNCWICNDSGLVPYVKYIGGMEYEFTYKCTCIRGQAPSSKLIIVPDIVAENLAIENCKRSEKVKTMNIAELIVQAKEKWALIGVYDNLKVGHSTN